MIWKANEKEVNMLRNQLMLEQALTKAMDDGEKYTFKICNEAIHVYNSTRYIGYLFYTGSNTLEAELDIDSFRDKMVMAVLFKLLQAFTKAVDEGDAISEDILKGLF